MNNIEKRLASILAKRWWLLVLRGLAAIAFGVITWLLPGITLASLVLLFGAYSLADGVLSIVTAITGDGDGEARWLLALEGILGVGVGCLTFFAPNITAVALVFFIAIWAVSTGVLEIVMAIRLRKEIDGEWLLGLAGLASVGFGVMIMAQPGAGALALLWLIGGYAILFGVLILVLAFKVRGFAKRLTG